MTSEELETIVCKHEMQRLDLKESFGVDAIEAATWYDSLTAA